MTLLGECKFFILVALAWFFIIRAPDGVEFTFGPYPTFEVCMEDLGVAHKEVGQHGGWVTSGCVELQARTNKVT